MKLLYPTSISRYLKKLCRKWFLRHVLQLEIHGIAKRKLPHFKLSEFQPHHFINVAPALYHCAIQPSPPVSVNNKKDDIQIPMVALVIADDGARLSRVTEWCLPISYIHRPMDGGQGSVATPLCSVNSKYFISLFTNKIFCTKNNIVNDILSNLNQKRERIVLYLVRLFNHTTLNSFV